jgi:basic amino acid/polyamine antiporter, APA family
LRFGRFVTTEAELDAMSPDRDRAEAVVPMPVQVSKPAEEGLVRRLGLFDMTMLVMGCVVGTGVFIIPSTVARQLRSSLLILSAWLTGGLISLIGAFIYAELSCRRPNVGGQYAYLREAYHPAVSFVYGWCLLLVVQTGAMAAVAIVSARYLNELTHLRAPEWLVAVCAISVLSFVNCLGVRTGSTTQDIFMLLKIAVILGIILCGFLLLTRSLPSLGLSTHAVPAHGKTNWELASAFGTAMVPILFSYGGWQMATFLGGEVRNPKTNLPRGLIIGVAGVIALYLGFNFVCIHAIGASGLATSIAPASDIMRRAIGDIGASVIALGITISGLGYLSQATLTSPRVYFAMARDGVFFRSVAWLHPRTRVPIVAIILQGFVAMVIAVSGKYDQILNYVMSVEMIFIVLTAGSVFWFRRTDREVGGSTDYAIPGHPVTTVFFMVGDIFVIIALFYKFPMNSLIGLGIALLGVPIYFLWKPEESPIQRLI